MDKQLFLQVEENKNRVVRVLAEELGTAIISGHTDIARRATDIELESALLSTEKRLREELSKAPFYIVLSVADLQHFVTDAYQYLASCYKSRTIRLGLPEHIPVSTASAKVAISG